MVVHENIPLAVGCNVTAQYDLRPCSVDSVIFQHLCNCRVVAFVHGCHGGFIRAVAHNIAGGFLAQQQRQCVNQDGLARAGFAGQQVQSRSKVNHHVIDDGVVFNAQFPEHSAPFLGVFPARIPRESCT